MKKVPTQKSTKRVPPVRETKDDKGNIVTRTKDGRLVAVMVRV